MVIPLLFLHLRLMAIPVQTIVTQMNSPLDAEGSDRYLFDLDHRPGIHYGIRQVITALNSVFANTKAPAESLRELINTRVWQANDHSRIAYNPADMPNTQDLWTILSVHPEALTIEGGTIDQLILGPVSKVRLDLTYKSSAQSCERLSFEQWSQNQENIFLPGNIVMIGALKRYAYLDFSDYSSNNYTAPGTYEIEIRPDVSRKLVGMRYLRYPVMPALITDSIEFPDSLTDLIVSAALSWLGWKQGNGTTLIQLSSMDVQKALGYIS